jgi:cytochrome c-type biogenesis protein
MRKTSRQTLVVGLCIFLLFMVPITYAEDDMTIVLYYSASCGSCKAASKLVDDLKKNYTGNNIVFIKKEVGSNQTNYNEWKSYGFISYPSIVINNETKIPRDNITEKNLKTILNTYLSKVNASNQQQNLLILILSAAGVILVIGILVAVTGRRKKTNK